MSELFYTLGFIVIFLLILVIMRIWFEDHTKDVLRRVSKMSELSSKIKDWEYKVAKTYASQDFNSSDPHDKLLLEGRRLFEEYDRISKGQLGPEMHTKREILFYPQCWVEAYVNKIG